MYPVAPSNATDILSLLETSKEQRQTFVQSVIASIKDGDADPLKIHLQVKNTEDLVKQITGDEEYRKLLLEESQKHGKSFERHNAKFEVKEVGTKYDFSGCGDPKLAELQAEADKANKALKEHQDWLKKAPAKGVVVTDQDSGETYTVYPPSKTSTTSVAITLK